MRPFFRLTPMTLPLVAAALLGTTARAQDAASSREPAPAPSGVESTLRSLVSEAEAAAGLEAAEPSTLVYWNRSVATFRARLGSQGPSDRVAAALQRLRGMSESMLRGQVAVRVGRIDGVDVALVSVGDLTVFALMGADLDPLSGKTLEQAAEAASKSLAAALAAREEQQRLPVLLRGLGEAAAATLLIVASIWLIRRLRRRLVRYATTRAAQGRRFHFLEVDLGESVRALLAKLLNLALWSIDAVLVWLWLTYVFSRFPYSEPWSAALAGWVKRTLGNFATTILSAIPNLATVLLILVVARATVALVSGLLRKIENGALEVSWLSPQGARGARRIVVLFILLFTLAIVFPFIPGSSSGTFRGVSVLVGLMFSVASAGLITHVMAGWVILFSRALQVGDFVRIGEVEGRVTQLGVLSVKLLDPLGEEVVLPKGVAGTTTTNFSRYAAADGAVAGIKVTIGYDAAWRQVHALLLVAAGNTLGVRPEPAPYVLQRSLSDFYVEYELVVETELERRARILSRLRANIQDEFNRHGVQIMSPHFRGQPANAVVVPPEKWSPEPASSHVESEAGAAERIAAGSGEPSAASQRDQS